jgi:lipopolysaccharide export system permease protein
MMRLSRYIFYTVFSAIFMVLCVIVGLDSAAAIIDETGSIQGNYYFGDVLIFVITKLPSTVYEYIPFSSLIGCLYGLGLLAGTSELTVMRASGVSLLRIVYFVMKPVVFFIIFAFTIGEYFAPNLDQRADGTREYLRNGSSSQDSATGLWIKEDREFMHFNAVFPGGVLYGVTRYQFNEDQELREASFSTRATHNAVEGFWMEENVSITHFSGSNISTEKKLTRQWNSELSPQILTVNVLPADSLPISTLVSHIKFLEQQFMDSAVYELAFWKKMLQPLVIISLVLVAISFVFGPLRESTMGFRIFIGVIIGISFKMIQDLLGPFSIVFGFPVLYAVTIPIFLCIVTGLFLLKRSG